MADDKSPPVRRGEIVITEITDLTHDGEGVGNAGGFTLFVPETAPGDRVEARVISVQKTYARALPLSILNYSKYRTEPRCRHFNRCGGCQLQHLQYGAQLHWKQKRVADTLRRLGQIEAPVRPVIGMAEPWAYRNKAQVPVAAENGRVVAGFYEKHSHQVVDMEACPIQHRSGSAAVEAARLALQDLGIEAYNEGTRRGVVRHILTRVSFATGELLLTLVTSRERLSRVSELTERLRTAIPALTGIVHNINPRPDNTVLGERELVLWGRPYLMEKLGGLTFHVSSRSFFQVNPAQTEALYEKALVYAGLTGRETVFDLYCGAGTIALYLARKAGQVIGVESVHEAVEDARVNALLNGIQNAHFYAGRAEEVVFRLIEEGCRADVMVVDPPRKGCATGLLHTMAAAAPRRIVYVSCNPATLARDLKILSTKGYDVIELQPVDMFPHTSHVECVTLMSRVKD